MFLYKPKIWNTSLTFSTEEEKPVLLQLSVKDIDKECEIVAAKKGKTTVLASHQLF